MVPMPRLAPDQSASPLCRAAYTQAAWFRDGPPPPHVELLQPATRNKDAHVETGRPIVYPDEIDVILNCAEQ